MTSRIRRLVGAATLILLTAGCQGGDSQDRRESTAACNHLSTEGDPGLGAGFDYDETHHPFDTAVPAKLCMTKGRGHIRLTGTSPQIVVDPQDQEGPGPVYDFTVTVSPGASGGISAQLVNESGEDSGGFAGPDIVTDASGWSFAPWGDTD